MNTHAAFSSQIVEDQFNPVFVCGILFTGIIQRLFQLAQNYPANTVASYLSPALGRSAKSQSGVERLWEATVFEQGPVVRRSISANPGLNFNPSLFFFLSKAFSRTIFSILFRVANHQIVDKKN